MWCNSKKTEALTKDRIQQSDTTYCDLCVHQKLWRRKYAIINVRLVDFFNAVHIQKDTYLFSNIQNCCFAILIKTISSLYFMVAYGILSVLVT